MAFQEKQESQQSGQPARLFRFKLGSVPFSTTPGEPGYEQPGLQGSAEWRVTDQDRAIAAPAVAPELWLPMNISDKGITISGQATADGYEVTTPASFELAQKFRGLPPAQTVALMVYDHHVSDTEDGETQVVWIGEVAEVRFPTPDTALFICVTLAAAFQRTGLRLSWGKNCPHVLYDSQCGLKIQKFMTPINIVSIIDGTRIEVDTGIPNDAYAGGMLMWQDPGGYEESIAIESTDGLTTITVFGTTEKLAGITAVNIVRGCARTVDACLTFNPDDPDRPEETTNILNFGGCPHMPEKNPFNGDPVF